MYYYKDICSGEIMEYLATDNILEIIEKIKNADFMFSDFEVIQGIDITDKLKEIKCLIKKF